MMYFYLDKEAQALFGPHYPLAAAPEALPADGLTWHVRCSRIDEVPVCVLIERISRYALVFTWTGPEFARHLPQILARRLATHLMLLLEAPARTHREEVEALSELYRQLMSQLNASQRFLNAPAPDDALQSVWSEIRRDLQRRSENDALPASEREMVEMDIALNRIPRAVENDDSVLPCESFRELMTLYVSARMMPPEEAKRFLDHLGEAVGIAPGPLAQS